MDKVKTFVLPGLDGTDHLLADFRELAPPTHDVSVLPLPKDLSDYSELRDHFFEAIDSEKRCTLIAESFSGPLAILLADRHPDVVNHLVLVATFVTSPVPRIVTVIPWSAVFRFPLPTVVARHFLVGKRKELVSSLQQAVRTQSCRTLARRVRSVLTIDVTKQFEQLTCAITYIRPTRDRLVPARSAGQISRLNKRVVVEEIDGPHLILQTEPQQAWKSIVSSFPGSTAK